MITLWTNFLAALKSLISKLEADLAALDSKLWPAVEKAFTAAEQQEINSLIPIAETVVNGLSDTEPKTLFSNALAGLETSIVSAGGTFVLTLATQALTLVIDDLKGATGTGNEGTVS